MAALLIYVPRRWVVGLADDGACRLDALRGVFARQAAEAHGGAQADACEHGGILVHLVGGEASVAAGPEGFSPDVLPASLSVEALREKREADLDARCEIIAERAGFTPREREVFALVARGKTNAAVAEELVVSENTVKFHIKSIYQKLGIHSKTEVAALVKDADE